MAFWVRSGSDRKVDDTVPNGPVIMTPRRASGLRANACGWQQREGHRIRPLQGEQPPGKLLTFIPNVVQIAVGEQVQPWGERNNPDLVAAVNDGSRFGVGNQIIHAGILVGGQFLGRMLRNLLGRAKTEQFAAL